MKDRNRRLEDSSQRSFRIRRCSSPFSRRATMICKPLVYLHVHACRCASLYTDTDESVSRFQGGAESPPGREEGDHSLVKHFCLSRLFQVFRHSRKSQRRTPHLRKSPLKKTGMKEKEWTWAEHPLNGPYVRFRHTLCR